tara:strand:- start:186 stop:1160 length:975 start_codon:yes stop_codon:yes gene_type:complete
MENLLASFGSVGVEKSNPPPQLDAAMAHQHLALLGKDEASSFLGAYKPNGSRKDLKPWTGPFSELETAQRKNQEGRGLYLGINNGSGLKDADIHECVAFWSEDDKRSKDEQLERWLARMPEPTHIVETGKSLHIYLVLKQPITPAVWKPIQSQLIDFVDGDPAVKSLSRVLRLAGSWYVNKDNELTQLVTLRNVTGKRYDLEEIVSCLPEVEPKPQPAPPKRHVLAGADYPSGTLRDIADALRCIPPRVPGTGTYPEYRNLLWGLISALAEADAGYGPELAITLMEAHSPQWRDVRQVANSGGEQISAGTFWHLAKQHGWRRHG